MAKIILIGRVETQSSCRFIKKAFEYRGHKVRDFCQYHHNVIQFKDKFPADFVFLMKPNSIDFKIVKEISNHFPIIFYFYDAFGPKKNNFGRYIKIAKESEIVLTANEEGAQHFSQINPNTYVLRQACNHIWLDTPSDTLPSQRKKFFFFAGTVNKVRNEIINNIKIWAGRNNQTLDQFGSGYGKCIPLNDLSKTTIQYQMCFNLPSDDLFDYVSNRVYNTLGVNTPIISWECSELKKLFTDGQNIIFFNNKDTMFEKLDYYFKNPRELDRIAKNGRNLILEKHNWDRRIQQVMQIFENHKKGVKI